MSENEFDEIKSKSQVKRELTAITHFAGQLVDAGHQRLEGLGFPDRVITAIAEGEKIKAHGGRKRQIKFIGKLLRDVDDSVLEAARSSLNSEGLEEKQRESRITKLRDRLITEGDGALGEVLNDYPNADRQQLRQLIRKACREAAEEKNQGGAKALLRELRRLAIEREEGL